MLPWLRTRCRRRRRWCQCLGILILVHHHRLHERARKCRQNFGCLGLKLCLFFDLRTSPYEYYRYARIEIQIKIRNTTLTIAATSFLLGVSSLYTMTLALRSPCSTLFVPRHIRSCVLISEKYPAHLSHRYVHLIRCVCWSKPPTKSRINSDRAKSADHFELRA